MKYISSQLLMDYDQFLFLLFLPSHSNPKLGITLLSLYRLSLQDNRSLPGQVIPYKHATNIPGPDLANTESEADPGKARGCSTNTVVIN